QVRMSPTSASSLVLFFVISSSIVSAYHHHSNGHTTPKPGPTIEERFAEFSANRTKAYNSNSDYFEPDRDIGSALTKCPDYCKPKLGNGQCDEECNIDGCFADLGDCTTRKKCWELDCPEDGKCRPICEINSCMPIPVCKVEEMKYRQIAVLVTPAASAKAVVKMTPRVEYMISHNANDTYRKELGGFLGPDVVFLSNKQGPLVWGHRGDYRMEQVKYNPNKQTVIQGGCTFGRGSISVISLRDPLDRIISYSTETEQRKKLMELLEVGVINPRKAFEITLLVVPESVLEGILGWFYFTELYRPWKVGQFRFFLTHEIHSEINDKYIDDEILCGPKY
ncbi:hypothetical protein PRIPAC_95815, partial [Pristionchus pacificus]